MINNQKLNKQNIKEKQLKGTNMIYINNKPNERIIERITLKHIKPKLTNPNKMIWRKYLKDLPEEIREVVYKHIKEYPIIERGCWYNSHLLSIINPEIEVVNGWYGKKISKSKPFYNVVKEYKSKEDFIKYSSNGNGEIDKIIDRKRMIYYSKHSWNRYKGNNFCITTELNPTYTGDFVYLNEQESFSGKVLSCNEDTKRTYLRICIDSINHWISMGITVINKNYLTTSTIQPRFYEISKTNHQFTPFSKRVAVQS